MPDLVLQFPRGDDEFRAALEKQFGNDAMIADVKSFDGVAVAQAVVTVVLPLAPFVLDFLVSYLKERKKRIVLTAEGEISLDNYSIEESKDLLIRIASKDAAP